MTTKAFMELVNATQEKSEAVKKARDQAYVKYSGLYEAAVKEKDQLSEKKIAASAAGDIEQYEEIREKLKKLDEDMDLYKVGMRSTGDVKVTNDEYEKTVADLKTGINDYVKEKEKSILSELEKAVAEINAMYAAVEGARQTGIAFCKAVKPNELNYANTTFSVTESVLNYAGLANRISQILKEKNK